jgi:hypothetical protein
MIVISGSMFSFLSSMKMLKSNLSCLSELSKGFLICLVAYRSGTKHNQQHNNQQSVALVGSIRQVPKPHARANCLIWKVVKEQLNKQK